MVEPEDRRPPVKHFCRYNKPTALKIAVTIRKDGNGTVERHNIVLSRCGTLKSYCNKVPDKFSWRIVSVTVLLMYFSPSSKWQVACAVYWIFKASTICSKMFHIKENNSKMFCCHYVFRGKDSLNVLHEACRLLHQFSKDEYCKVWPKRIFYACWK